MGLFRRRIEMPEEEDYLDELELQGDDEIMRRVAPEKMAADTLDEKKQAIENYCDRIMEANARISELKVEYQTVNSYLSDIQKLENLPQRQFEAIRQSAKKVVVLEKDRRDFGKSMSKLSDRQFSQMNKNEDEIKNILKSMVEDEKYCETVKRDMKYLEAEKAGCKMQIQQQEDLLYVLSGISKMGIIAVVGLLIIFATLSLGYGHDMSMWIYGLISAAIILTALIFYFHNKANYEIKITRVRLNRAIGLLNKVKLKYVNVASRLSYTYEKNGVKSAYQYNQTWGTYLRLKKEHEVYNRASLRLIDAENELTKLVEEAGIKDVNIWINQVYALVDNRDMDEIKKHLSNRRDKLKGSLDYNSDTIEKSRNEIKNIILKDKKNAQELMDILDAYEEEIS